jgi:dihydrofolate reductase
MLLMRKLAMFNQLSLDGFFATKDGDIRWAHRQDDDVEFRDFVAANASGGGELLFGRKTYEMMASFWPTPLAAQQMPIVAKGMNEMTKHVVSRSLSSTAWSNARLLRGDLVEAVSALKKSDGPDVAILGSGSIVAQLSRAALIDEYQLLFLPFAVGEGRTLFEGAKAPLELSLVKTRTFKNGNVFLVYEPKR